MTSPEHSNLRRKLLRVSNWLTKWLKCDLPHCCWLFLPVRHCLEGVARPCTAGTGIDSQWQCQWLRWIHYRRRRTCRFVVTQSFPVVWQSQTWAHGKKNRIIHIIWNYSYYFLSIVQVLNHLVYHHVHFDGVTCLECTFINQDTKFFPGSGRVFSSAWLVVRTQSFS